jgi:hypothetical protein
MSDDSPSIAVAETTFRVLSRRGRLGYLPFEKKDEVFAEVKTLCGSIDWYDFVEGLRLVARLLEDSYQIAERARDAGEPDHVASGKLKLLYPDLAADVVDGALLYGWLASR